MKHKKLKPGIVALTSGGLDSSLMALMLKENGWDVTSVFVDYGHLSRVREWTACRNIHKRFDLVDPIKIRVPEFGRAVKSGLTNKAFDVVKDAFLPGRNMLFLLVAASIAADRSLSTIAIGLLNEEHSLFSDQTGRFLSSASECLALATGKPLNVIAPLIAFNKPDVVALARERGLTGTYSCHRGTAKPCGKCISCNEFKFLLRS